MITTVKELQALDPLPEFKVKDGKNILPAIVRGRLLDYPHIYWGDGWKYSAEVSWHVLLHCLQNNLPVTV